MRRGFDVQKKHMAKKEMMKGADASPRSTDGAEPADAMGEREREEMLFITVTARGQNWKNGM